MLGNLQIVQHLLSHGSLVITQDRQVSCPVGELLLLNSTACTHGHGSLGWLFMAAYASVNFASDLIPSQCVLVLVRVFVSVN